MSFELNGLHNPLQHSHFLSQLDSWSWQWDKSILSIFTIDNKWNSGQLTVLKNNCAEYGALNSRENSGKVKLKSTTEKRLFRAKQLCFIKWSYEKKNRKKSCILSLLTLELAIISTKIVVWDCKALCCGNLVVIEIHSLS